MLEFMVFEFALMNRVYIELGPWHIFPLPDSHAVLGTGDWPLAVRFARPDDGHRDSWTVASTAHAM